MQSSQSKKATALRSPFRRARWLIVATAVVIASALCWSLTRTAERRVFSLETLPRDKDPAFISTSKPTRDLGPLTGLPLHKQLKGMYLKLRMSIFPPKPNPAAYTFPASDDRRCSVHGLLNQCAQVTGTRYLIAREVSADSIYFGHARLNGTQWVAAFEKALQQDGYVLIRERSELVKVIPKGVLVEYERAGLVKKQKTNDQGNK